MPLIALQDSDDFDSSMYQDAFINSPMGHTRINKLLAFIRKLAGLDVRTNHVMRRPFIQSCYRAGMPEPAIMQLSRHTSVDGLRT